MTPYPTPTDSKKSKYLIRMRPWKSRTRLVTRSLQRILVHSLHGNPTLCSTSSYLSHYVGFCLTDFCMYDIFRRNHILLRYRLLVYTSKKVETLRDRRAMRCRAHLWSLSYVATSSHSALGKSSSMRTISTFIQHALIQATGHAVRDIIRIFLST